MHRTLWPEAVELKALDYCPSCRAQIEEAERSRLLGQAAASR